MTLPPLKDMWPHYPTETKDQVAVLVGGAIGTNIIKYDWETCCIRLSRALNLSGAPIAGFEKMANPHMSGPNPKVRARKGADSKWYIYSCYDLRVYLENRFGRPKRFGSYEASDLSDERGIIMFAFRHVDLWDGSDVRYNHEFTNGTKTVQEICIWRTPS